MKHLFTTKMVILYVIIAFAGIAFVFIGNMGSERVMEAVGEISSVDTKANYFTLKTEKHGVIKCDVNPDTEITLGMAAKKTLSDVKVGDMAVSIYTVKEGKHICKNLEVKRPAT
jgi:hypothetical protein